MENQFSSQDTPPVITPKENVIQNLDSKVKGLLDKIDNGDVFKTIVDSVFKISAYLFLIFGALSCVMNIFGDDGYFSRFEWLEGGEKFTATLGFIIGLAICLLVVYIVFTMISKRADQLKSENYDGILTYMVKKTFPVLLVTFGEVFSVLLLTIGVLFVFASLLGSMVYFPLADIANTMSDVLDMGIAENSQIFLAGSWDDFSDGMKMAAGIIVLSPLMLVGTYIFRAIYNYCVGLTIKLIDFSISKTGVLVLFIGLVLSYIVMEGVVAEIFQGLF
jgi:hypothetical protein